jgi:hypothetical protein
MKISKLEEEKKAVEEELSKLKAVALDVAVKAETVAVKVETTVSLDVLKVLCCLLPADM